MNELQNFLLRAFLRAEDWARVKGLSRFPALVKMLGGLLLNSSNSSDNIARYLVSSHPSSLQKPLALKALALCRNSITSMPTSLNPNTTITRSIIVKSPVSATERGMLIISFESQLEKLAKCPQFADIEKLYQIVFLPTWQPSYSNALFLFAARATKPYYLMPAAPDDLGLNAVLGELCVPLPFQASSWVNSKALSNKVPRNIDILVVANFGKYKRHWRLFEGLCDLPASLRVVLAGRPWEGRTVETLFREATAFGVADRIEIIQNASDQEMATLLSSARLFCAMSHKEGSYIAVAEALIAGTPVAIYANAIVGSKVFIQQETGFFLDPARPLAPQLIAALERAPTLDPAGWARQNIASDSNVRKLNEWLHKASQKGGEPWTHNIVPFHCRNFVFEYSQPNDAKAFAQDYQRLAGYGLHIEGFNLADSTAPKTAVKSVVKG